MYIYGKGEVDHLSEKHAFPLFVDISQNNCTVVGGSEKAAECVRLLLLHGAHVTVISPRLCASLQEAAEKGYIRHLPRKFFRGDCNQAMLCVAATDDRQVNIAVAVECKAKNRPVYVTDPNDYSSFQFPVPLDDDDGFPTAWKAL